MKPRDFNSSADERFAPAPAVTTGAYVWWAVKVAGIDRLGAWMFSSYVQERLGYYVYMLFDPRADTSPFYVGKGIGNRVFAHAHAALDSNEERSSDKIDLIREIQRAGHEVRYELLRSQLTEREALEVEAAAIQLLDLHELTNMIAGHHVQLRGRMSVDVAISLFDAPPVQTITEPALLIKIPRLWYPSMPADELFEATSGWWRISERREQARYAFSINNGVIREVYEIEEWRQRQPGDRGSETDLDGSSQRWGFRGHPAPGLDHYRNKSVRHLYKRGEASPIKFLNC